MSIYAVGDVQGCFDELQQLLSYIKFDAQCDILWLTGDLVSRGPKSLEMLRFIKSLGVNAITVLGNHDLHLLAIAQGVRTTNDVGIKAILQAPDREELLNWLRQRPLMHHSTDLGYCLIHAGLPPQWDLEHALVYAGELEQVLRSETYGDFLLHMYGDHPSLWSDGLTGWDRLRFICNSFTRLRYCDKSGRMNLQPTGAPGTQPDKDMPWFQIPRRKSKDHRIIFGHWSTLGIRNQDGIFSLDSGCVWGGRLTALCLDGKDEIYYNVDCLGHCDPGEG